MTSACEFSLPRVQRSLARRLVGIRIAVVEDHALLAQSLRFTLGAEGADVRVVDLTSPGAVLADCLSQRPAVVLLDLDLGSLAGDGTALIAPLAESGAAVLVLTGSTDSARLGRCFEVGASGVIEKTEELDVLVEQVRRAAAGEHVGSDQRRHDLLVETRHQRETRQKQLAPFDSLTERESDVLAALLRGRQVQQISRDLFVSTATVRTHVRGILQKLDVRSQLAAVAQAREAGWQSAAPHWAAV
jgi:DNA-binding NarL/FixJ family response regulator